MCLHRPHGRASTLRHPVMGDHGFYNETAQISFPLSSKMLLLMAWNDDALDSRDYLLGVGQFRAQNIAVVLIIALITLGIALCRHHRVTRTHNEIESPLEQIP